MKKRIVFNNPDLKLRRQKLRRDSTSSEKVLWNKIRDTKLGYRFLRQYSVEGYVLDFYCPEKRLGVEIDGGYHQKLNVKKYDSFRTRYLEAYNIKISRFWNSDIKNNIKEVLADVRTLLASPS